MALPPEVTGGGSASASIPSLIAETRRLREALHELVCRLRRDRLGWERTLAEFALRSRLTRGQREQFRRHASTHARRR